MEAHFPVAGVRRKNDGIASSFDSKNLLSLGIAGDNGCQRTSFSVAASWTPSLTYSYAFLSTIRVMNTNLTAVLVPGTPVLALNSRGSGGSKHPFSVV